MATKQTTEAAPVAEPEVVEIDFEDRIDEDAISMFQHLGFKGRLPAKLVEVYNDFKRVKDRVQPGRLSPDGYAAVVTLYQFKAQF